MDRRWAVERTTRDRRLHAALRHNSNHLLRDAPVKMSENGIVRMSLEEAVRRLESGETSTDWDRVDALTDEEIGRAVA